MSAQASLLVVDDEDVICRSCAKIFERAGFEVATCTSSREALRLAVARDYGAILLDLRMPDLQGLDFLAQLRAVRPDVPVIIITGYPSVTSAVDALRLRAADYVHKPFTPTEILEAVRRVVARHPVAEPPAAPPPYAVHPMAAQPPALGSQAGVVFFEAGAWMRLEADDTVWVGAFLSGDEASGVERARIAAVGDKVLRGLPLAELTLAGGRRLVIPAPASGAVVEVNQALLAAPAEALRDPCATGWLAHLRPTAAAADLLASRVRRVVLASGAADGVTRLRQQLEHFGCAVQTVADAAAVRPLLRRTPSAVLMIDADSMATAGLELVRAVGATAPDTKIVVLATSDAAYEMAYRTERVFYYAVTPLGDGELVDILRSAFREPARPPTRRREPNPLEPSLRSIRIRNRQAELVVLLSSGKLLFADHGLGAAILERLAGAAYPLETSFGAGDLGMNDISLALGANDHALVLWSHDSARIPGTLLCRPLFNDGAPRPAAKHAVTLMVQPSGDGDPLGFEPALTEALAAAIVDKMTAPRQSAAP